MSCSNPASRLDVATAGWEPTPWHATQRAAWEALNRAKRDG
jgi:hypothetical protein